MLGALRCGMRGFWLVALVLVVLAVPAAGKEVRSPAVYALRGGMEPLEIPFVSESGEIGLLVEPTGFRVVVRSPHQAEPLAVVEGPSEEVVVSGRDVPAGGPVVIEVEAAPPGATAFLRWDDPDWYARAPTVGHIAAVVAVAALVTIHHGRSPRRQG